MPSRKSAAFVALCLLVAAPASAAVTYSFSDAPDDLSFVWTTPTFLSGTIVVPLSQLATCHASVFRCGPPAFYSDTTSFTGADDHDVLIFDEGAAGKLVFYFANDAFKTAGVYKDNVFFAGGRLTVTDSAAVPEPATWALVVTGFGIVGAAVRRRRAMVIASA